MFDKHHVLVVELAHGARGLAGSDLWIRAALTAAALSAWAAVVASSAEPASSAAAPPAAGQTEQDAAVGPVRAARPMLGAMVHDHAGNEVGKIVDLALDIGKGSVAGVLLSQSQASTASRESMGIPITHLHWNDHGQILLGEESRKTSDIVLPGNTDNKRRTVRLTEFGQPEVQNAQGDKLGHIEDLALATRTGLIAYAALRLADRSGGNDVLYPVPLAAFVAPPAARHWVLELPRDVLINTPHFDKGHWPDKVSLTWMEYVRERYGRSPFGGVERELHEPR
jgi:sporulation protein YlmC with PRC-barrel domain